MNEEIRLVKSEKNGWTVIHGKRYADYLGADEALWTVARILAEDPCPGYLRTAEEHEAKRKLLVEHFAEQESQKENRS